MRSFEERLKEIWTEEREAAASGSTLAGALRLLSIPYGAVVSLRNRVYDRGTLRQEKLPCPVISVGNLTVGGTGKTPTVILLAHLLRDRGRNPAVLSRGYGGKALSPVQVVSDGKRILRDWREAGDEPVLIAQAAPGVPVLTGPKRVLTGRAAVERFGADCLILDDAFQHRALFRDLDILLLDAARPFGNGFLLPLGPLRETPESLNRARLILRTGPSEPESSPLIPPSLPSFRGTHRPRGLVEAATGRVLPLSDLKDRKVFAFAGIGAPASFRYTLAALGAQVVSFRAFPDHHRYGPSDIEAIRRLAEAAGAEHVLTTEKDGVRLSDFPSLLPELLLLRIGMEIAPAEPFAELIFSALTY